MATLVQSVKNAGAQGFVLNVTAGDGMIIAFQKSNSSILSQITSITDTQGNVWTKATNAFSSVASPIEMSTDIWYCASALASGNLTVAVHTSDGNAPNSGYLYEVHGAIALDVAANRSGAGIPSVPAIIETNPVTPSAGPRIYIACAVQVELFVIPTVDSPWVMGAVNLETDPGVSAYAIGSGELDVSFFYPANWNGTTSTDWASSIAAFIASADSGGGGGGGGGAPIISGGPGSGFMATQVPSPNLDCSVQQRQVLYGISGVGPYASAPLVSADRRTGLQSDGSTGGVVSFLVAPPLAGALSTVIVSGCQDESFDGVYDQPTSAAWGADGVNLLLQFKQDGPDSSSFGGTLQSTLPSVRVVRQEEGRYDDNGSAIDSQYQPAFARGGMLEVMRWGGYRTQLKGEGQAILTPVSEDPDAPQKSTALDLVPTKPKAYERGVRVEDGKYLTLLVTNGKKPGSHFELHQLTLYGSPYLPGERH